MSFPYAAIPTIANRSCEVPAQQVLVSREIARRASEAALLAAARMRQRNLEEAVEQRLAAAVAHNGRWYAFGPFKASEDRSHIAARLVSVSCLEDDRWFFIDMPVRFLERAANTALRSPTRNDGCILIDKKDWELLELYVGLYRMAAASAK